MEKRIPEIYYLILLMMVFLISSSAVAQDFIVGGDVSSLRQVEDNGGVFSDSGEAGDLFEIMNNHNFNWFRLKIWHTPSEPYNDLQRVKEAAVRGKELGMSFLLDFHYSDSWADPGQQTKPAAWEDLEFNVLVDSVYQYTLDVMEALQDTGAMPDMVQIGNEINCGLLWPDGNVCGTNNNATHWNQLAQLITAGIDAVHDSEAEGDTVGIMIHHATGNTWFFDNLLQRVDGIDYLGRSFYPLWHGDLDDLEDNLTTLANRYDQKIIVAETGYPWTLDWSDPQGNLFGSDDALIPGYPASVDGQTSFLRDERQIVQNLPDGKGVGIFYWEPAWITTPTFYTPWENVCLFDFDGNTLPSIDALSYDPQNQPSVNITMQINTSTLWDTLRPDDILQIRGEVDGVGGRFLPDGSEISWTDDSQLLPENLSGDYWEITFPIYVGDTLKYKFWTGFSFVTPTAQRLGWEGPVIPGDGIAGNTRQIVAGENDTTIIMQFINGSGATVEQYWHPYEIHEDSIVVYYRVNMAHAQSNGIFNPDNGDEVGVIPFTQGESFTLTREEYSVGGGTFWSGTEVFHTSELTDGLSQTYKFEILNSEGSVLENIERSWSLDASFAKSDTTLFWTFFNEYENADVEENSGPAIIEDISLRAFPNPFNSTVKLSFDLPASLDGQVNIYNLIGQEVWTTGEKRWSLGQQKVLWSGINNQGQPIPSGIYFVTWQGQQLTQSMKILLIK